MVIFHSYVSLPEGNYYGWWLHRIPRFPRMRRSYEWSRGHAETILHGEEKRIFLYQNKLFLLLIVIVHDCISTDSIVVNSG